MRFFHNLPAVTKGLKKNCERFEPRSHFKSRLSLIVRVNVVLNKTVVVDSDWRFDSLWGGHLQSQKKGKFAIFSTKEVCNVKKEALPMFS